MNTKLKGVLQLLVILLVTAAVCVVAYTGIGGAKRGSAKNIRLGLDLAGGVSVTYEATKENPTAQEMKDTVYKMQMRVQNESTEASVYQEGNNRVTVDVPDVDDPQAVLDKLGKAGALEFVLYNNVKVGEDGKTATYDKKDVIIDGSMLKTAEAATQQDSTTGQSENVVKLSFNAKGTKKFKKVTTDHVGEQFSIIYDGEIVSSPVIREAIDGGEAVISGSFDEFSKAEDMASTLRIGALPLELKNIRSNIVGAKLGGDALKTSLIAGAIGLGLVIIFMIVMYWIPGVAASLALLFYVGASVLAINGLDVTLTLPGIAGVILAIGMAVDANVLIYERTKEELRAGKGVKKALADGYSNAFSAIFDSNLTSIITGIILFNFGTGPIRGFATTLIIGILVSFFTAVFMTRLVYEHFMSKDKWLGLTFTTKISKNLMTNTRFDFMGTNKKSLIIVSAVIIVCISSFAIRGLSQSIDFTGGRNFKVQFENKVEPEQIRELISSKFGDANVSVIAIGTDGKTVRISTNYRIEEEGNNIDSEIEAYLYETLKPVLTQNITLETFIDRENHTGGSIISSQKVGPSIADDIKVSAIWSVVLALIAIGIYILIRFRNIAYSIGSVAALACDTIIILGAYSICWGWMPFSLEIDQTFIGAILTAIGYSINDKVVIFDRVREFFGLYPKRDKFQLFNDSLNTTLARTINTSLSTLIVLLCIFILGGDSIRSFAFAMILGVVFGTMSSLFVASPIAYILIKGKKSSELNEVSE